MDYFKIKKGLLIVCLFVCFGCKTSSEEKTDITTYYFLRHAEKDKSDPSNKNPELSKKGLKRVENWKKHFKNIHFDAVYSTNYYRTKQTAQPIADANTLEITFYQPNTIEYDAFLSNTKKQTVLIVGHSNTTPNFVNKIIGEKKYNPIDETVNNKLFIITIKGKKITSKVKTID